jgi:hypothetical protein
MKQPSHTVKCYRRNVQQKLSGNDLAELQEISTNVLVSWWAGVSCGYLFGLTVGTGQAQGTVPTIKPNGAVQKP